MSQQEKDKFITPVIFRWWKNEVIALFPADPGTSKYDCMSYMHVGQHSHVNDRMIFGNRVRLPLPNTPISKRNLNPSVTTSRFTGATASNTAKAEFAFIHCR
jgi:hypothetical protein